MQTIQILTTKEIQLDQGKIQNWKIELPQIPKFMSMRIGIDPGTAHIGIAQIDPCNNLARIWQINKHREENNWQRIINVQHLLKRLDILFSASYDVIIEGASFGDRYRQVELAEIRASIALWFYQYGGRCHIIPPTKIRKQVFDDGKMKADQAWDGLPPDALAALSCAYYII